MLNSKLVDEWVLLGFLTGISVRGYLQEQKWLKDSCITKAHPSMGDSSQSWEPGAHCTACRQPHRLGSVFPGASVGLNLSWQLSFLLPERDSQLLLLSLTGRCLMIWSVSGTSCKYYIVDFLSFRKLPPWWEFSHTWILRK